MRDENTGAKVEQLKWSREETLLLINSVGKHIDEFDFKIKKIVWKNIAEEIEKKIGKIISGTQCDTKWKLLKKMYKKIRDEKNQSGSGRKKWEFFEHMHDLLSKKPEIAAEAVCKSTSSEVIINENVSSNNKDGDINIAESGDELSSRSENTPPVFKKRKRETSAERRHIERMARQDRFLNLFEEMVKKL